MRKAAQIFDRAKVDVIGMVQIVSVACGSDPHRFGLSVQLEVVIFGQNAQFKLSQKTSKSRSIPGVRYSSIEWYEPGDAKIAKIVRGLFKPNYAGVPIDNLFGDPPPPRGWSKRAERDLRAFVVLMAMAQLPVSKMLIFNGAGGPIFAQAIAQAKLALKAACKKSLLVIHPEGIPHFFFSELRRLGLDDISVPIVKLR